MRRCPNGETWSLQEADCRLTLAARISLNGCQQNRVQASSNNGFTDENALLSVVPRPLTATIIATLIPAATSVHSITFACRSESEKTYFILHPGQKILDQQS